LIAVLLFHLSVARKVRVEYAGAFYHVINRGNYRSWIFESEGTRKSFLKCLVEVCEAKGWRVHAWCLMSNHYHLLIETPEPNLVAGMRWLQSTFANRFNRYRKENGHVFQGRYKALLIDGEAIGTVCHYIHLNPVRAGLIDVGKLEGFADSSFHQLWYPGKRWSFGAYDTCLEFAGELADKPKGRRLYRDYLRWLTADDTEQKRLGFAKMSRGWAKGSKEFKKAVLEDIKDKKLLAVKEHEAVELREVVWMRSLQAGLIALEKSWDDVAASRKGADWKISLARYLRERYLVPHNWIADNLKMGEPSSVQSWVSRHRKNTSEKVDLNWLKLKNHGTLD
jgi:putative transposase